MAEEGKPESLVSHFLYSKKALAHGQTLCARASTLSATSANTLVDALALDAKTKWMLEGILDQLALATVVAKSLSSQRTKLLEEARGWDTLRAERNQSLDAILESLGSQLVPPGLHQMSSGSSLFGSQHSLSEPLEKHSKGETVLNDSLDPKAKWKTLRDFVDEKGIEEALEHMDEDRNVLDDVLASTATHPAALNKQVADIRNSLPSIVVPPRPLNQLLLEQEDIASEMASRLESLTTHYDQMSRAFRDEELGQSFSPEDMEVFLRDTNELPTIIAELEASVRAIERINEQIVSYRDASQVSLEALHDSIAQLEALESTMDAMLELHRGVQTDAATVHQTLQGHHQSLHELEETYHLYQLAYDHLIVEMDRRSQYRQTVQALIDGWSAQLNSLRDEEMAARERFIADHGGFLPGDLCPYVPDLPPKWAIECDGDEGAVSLTASIVTEAKKNLGFIEGELSTE